MAAAMMVVCTLAGCATPGTGPMPGASPARGRIVRTAGCATVTSPPAMTVAGTPQPANQEYLDGVAGRVQPYARAHFTSVYSGLELRSEQNRLRVYRKPSAGFDAWVLRDFKSECIEVVDALHSERELTAFAGRISGDFEYWRKKGVPVNYVSPAGDGSAVEVGTTDIERTKREFALRYGTAVPLKVVYGQPMKPL